MSLTTRVAISSFDNVISSLELNSPDAAAAHVAWSRAHQRCAVMGLFDDDGAALDVKPDVLARLTGLFARPVPEDALRLMFPDADTSTGSVLLDVRVSMPASVLVATNVLDLLVSGVPVADGDVRDALWLLLDALTLPAGSVQVHRLVMVPEFAGDAVFAPVALFEYPDGSGASLPWERALSSMPSTGVISSSIAALSSELAERAERAAAMMGNPTLLTDALVPL